MGFLSKISSWSPIACWIPNCACLGDSYGEGRNSLAPLLGILSSLALFFLTHFPHCGRQSPWFSETFCIFVLISLILLTSVWNNLLNLQCSFSLPSKKRRASTFHPTVTLSGEKSWPHVDHSRDSLLSTTSVLFHHWRDSFPSFSLSTSVLRPITAASYLFPLLLHDWLSAVYLLQSRETTASTLYRFVFVGLRDLFSPDDLSPSHLGNLSQMDLEDFSAISFFLFWVFSASHAAFSALAIWLKLSLCASLKTGLPSSPAPPPACWAQALAGSAPAVGPDSCCCWCDARGVNNYQPICYKLR